MLRLLAWFIHGSRAKSSASGRNASATPWTNQAWRPVDDGLEWCLIGATGDDAEACPALATKAEPAGAARSQSRLDRKTWPVGKDAE
jgi:hypothetical protein